MITINHNQVDLQENVVILQRALSFDNAIEKLKLYFQKARVLRVSNAINNILLKLIFTVEKKIIVPDKEFHTGIKEALFALLELRESIPEQYSSDSKIVAIFEENVALGYNLEKIVRVALYEKKKTTDVTMSEALSGLSKRNVAKALYDNKST